MIVVDYSKCCWKNGSCEKCSCGSSSTKCVGCVEACPVGAIKRKKKVEIDKKLCTSCGACVKACPKKALSMKK